MPVKQTNIFQEHEVSLDFIEPEIHTNRFSLTLQTNMGAVGVQINEAVFWDMITKVMEWSADRNAKRSEG